MQSASLASAAGSNLIRPELIADRKWHVTDRNPLFLRAFAPLRGIIFSAEELSTEPRAKGTGASPRYFNGGCSKKPFDFGPILAAMRQLGQRHALP